MQCLLIDTSKTIEDLSALSFAMPWCYPSRTEVLCRLAAHICIYSGYISLREDEQRTTRRAALQNFTDQTDVSGRVSTGYFVHGLKQTQVDSVVFIFAASCLLLHGLSTTSSAKRGFVSTNLDKPSLAPRERNTLPHP